jgi:hypothetical protein
MDARERSTLRAAGRQLATLEQLGEIAPHVRKLDISRNALATLVAMGRWGGRQAQCCVSPSDGCGRLLCGRASRGEPDVA